MAFKSLRDFIEILEEKEQLVRITERVSTKLEITEISRRTLHQSGPALLFENVVNEHGKPSSMPVLTNLFGTVERVAMGLNTTPDALREIGRTLAFFKQPEPPDSIKEAFSLLPFAKIALAMKPKSVKKAPCQEVIWQGDEVNLDYLPIQTCWPGDIGPLMTWPLVVTKGPSNQKEDQFNLGIYRLQKRSKNEAIMRWLKHRGGAQHYQRWKGEKKEPLPAAAVFGADPGIILGAVTPVPDTLSEYHFAGMLRKKKVELVDCKTIPLKVPAEAEIVLEGYVSLEEYADEGPFGDHTGYYNSVEPFPIFKITAMTMRKKPIYLSTYTGKPPDEPAILGEALNEIFIPLIQQQFPEIVDFWLPPEGCSYRIAVVSIRKAYAGHAKRIMMGVWSFLRQFIYTKWVIVVDHTINVRDWKEVMWAISTKMDPVRDITLIDQTPIDYLDFASPLTGLGGKIGLDATDKIGEETQREWGEQIQMDASVIQRIDAIWQKLKIV